ncbi:MAG: hypothetical protein HGA76_07460 [Candidatus Firestonebacteria bacterium]|nr:hypothetical protein [Candidatus Firestonebacteria bacterium]
MRIKPTWLLLGLCWLSLPGSAPAAITNNWDNLILGAPGDTLVASGVIYRNISIVVQPGTGIYLPPNQTSDSTKWSLQLVAPFIYIGGTLCAEGVSFATTGQGVAGSNSNSGTGGSGYGGAGGLGQNNPGTGGAVYGADNLEHPGSAGTGNPYGGGGSIRIDAETLTLAATALINARASQYVSHTTGGGGSGGGIFLNGINTYLAGGYTLTVDGGPGQISGLYGVYNFLTHTWHYFTSAGGGGGGGGRIKIYKYPYSSNSLFHDNGGTLSAAGGPGGGGSPLPAAAGQTGQIAFTQGYIPYAPELQSPSDGAQVGLEPTLLFYGTDIKNSQFFQFQIQADTSATFSSGALVTENQLVPDAGWGGQPYYKYGQMAAYTFQAYLASGQTYYWRVRATNSNGYGGTYAWSSWSSVRTFTTSPIPPPNTPLFIYPPLAPVTGNVSKTPSLKICSGVPDAAGDTLTFSLVLSQDPSLSNPKIIQPNYPGWDAAGYFSLPIGVTATCQILNTSDHPDALEPGATYYWQATVYDAYMMSRVSAKGLFSVVPLPLTPVLMAPAQLETVTTRTPSFQMRCDSPNALPQTYQYRLELSQDNFLTVTTYLSKNGTGWAQTQFASGTLAGLQIPSAYALVAGQTYAWRVTAYDVNNDNWSPVSETRTFTVVTPPNLPQLLSPDNNFTAPDASLNFQFQAVSDAGNTLTFRYELSHDNFRSTQLMYDQRASSGAVWNAPVTPPGGIAVFSLPAFVTLQRGTPYQWRVSAWDGFSWSPFSETRTFSLAASLDLAVSKVYPNPAVSCANLHVVLQPTVDAEATLHLFNAQAKEIRRVSWHLQGGRPNDYLLDIANCAPGAYFTITEISSPFGNKKWVTRFAVVN